MSDDTVLVGIDSAVATITLNRPETHNAFDDALIARLTDALSDLGASEDREGGDSRRSRENPSVPAPTWRT